MDIKDPESGIIDCMMTLLRGINDNDVEQSAKSHVSIHTARQMQQFIDEIPGGFLIYRAVAGEQIVYANKALLQIFKCDTFTEFMELTGGSFRGVVHPDDIERVEYEITDQIKDGGELDYLEYRITRKDGVVRWVEDYGHFVRSRNAGNFFYVFITDATEKTVRRMAETATLLKDKKEKELKLQNLIEEYDKERKLIRQEHLQRLEVIEGLSVNYDSIIYVDIEKNIALPYRLSTRLVHQFTQKLEVRELSWFLDDYVKVWVHPDDREFVRKRTSIAYMRRQLKDKRTYYINYRCIQNGEVQYIQLRLANVSNDNNVSQIVLGYRNVDEEVLQEMYQKQLLETALTNARNADAAKNSFLSNMSHDMRTPLNAIFGYLQLARKAEEPNSPTQQYLNKIETAGQQILDLVNKVLELSYEESRDESLNEDAFNIIDVLTEEINRAIPQARQKGVQISLNTRAVKMPNVIGDKNKLSQVVGHLIDNAIKYNKAGGNVEIRVSERTGLLNRISTFTINVMDNGIGISESKLEHIFDPFFRENNSTESGVFGAGLGLTICKQLVDAMNGNIVAKSTLGKGSTFTVTLSLKPNVVMGYTPSQTDGHINMTGKKILIVEDNEINLEIETEILQDFGFITDSAENGQIALEKIKNAKVDDYDLVLMDIQMPVMDGRTATREIRKLNSPLANIPIIALSANAFDSDRRASLEAGMDAHINKPLDIGTLLYAIQTAFQTRK